MNPEPRLIGPIAGSFIALLCFFFGRYVIPEDWQSARVFFILVGGFALLWAIFGWADWVAFRFNVHLAATKQAWNGTALAIAREINLMDTPKLRVFERVGPIESIGYLSSTGMIHKLYTPMMNIPFTWIMDYLERCEKSYPAFIPQHGMPDSLQRDYVQAFTGQMINNGLAEKPIGNRPAKWILSLDQVYEKLDLAEV